MGAAATTTWVRDCGTRGHRTNRASATGRQRGGPLCKDIWRAPRGGWQRNIFEYILYYIFAGRSACHGDTHRVDDHDLDLREAGPTAAAEGGKSKGRGGGETEISADFPSRAYDARRPPFAPPEDVCCNAAARCNTTRSHGRGFHGVEERRGGWKSTLPLLR